LPLQTARSTPRRGAGPLVSVGSEQLRGCPRHFRLPRTVSATPASPRRGSPHRRLVGTTFVSLKKIGLRRFRVHRSLHLVRLWSGIIPAQGHGDDSAARARANACTGRSYRTARRVRTGTASAAAAATVEWEGRADEITREQRGHQAALSSATRFARRRAVGLIDDWSAARAREGRRPLALVARTVADRRRALRRVGARGPGAGWPSIPLRSRHRDERSTAADPS
jgi:hypothetical protein